MFFQYGSYQHDVNSVSFNSIQRNYVDGQTGRHNLLRVNWSLKGKIIRPSMSEIMDQLTILQQTYSIGGQSAGMYDNNGLLIPAMSLDNSVAIGGVLVTNPISHEAIRGAEGTTYLYYTFGLQAEFIGPPNLLSFQESVSFNDINGGPLQIERVPVQGSPILQNITETSWYRATQSGSLTQNTANPLPMPMLFPGNLRGQDGAKTITFTPVKTIRGVPMEWGIQWKYDYISTTVLAGLPNIRG